jgi:hypothetical protein
VRPPTSPTGILSRSLFFQTAKWVNADENRVLPQRASASFLSYHAHPVQVLICCTLTVFRYQPFSGECALPEADLLDPDQELVLIRLPYSVDPSVLHGASFPLDGGSIGGTGLSVSVDDLNMQEQLTAFIPGGNHGFAVPVKRSVHRALTLRAIPAETSTVPKPVNIMPRATVPQLSRSKMRYKLLPIGHGTMPLLARGEKKKKNKNKVAAEGGAK